MEETERASVKDGLLQGDILRIVDDESNFGFSLGVIINADCDMQNEKHDGVIAILPIYTFKQYLEKFWLKNFLSRQYNEALDVIRNVVDMQDQHIDDLVAWLRADSASVFAKGASNIFESYQLSAKQLAKVSEALIKLHNAISSQSDATLSCVSKFAPIDESKASKYCRDQVLEAKKQMGEGHFFITEIKDDDGVGFVVRMRRIYTLPVDVCFSSNSAYQCAGAEGVAAVRICRLAPHYKFKISQLFAYQYSRIGLPDDTTALSELAIADMAFHLQGTKSK